MRQTRSDKCRYNENTTQITYIRSFERFILFSLFLIDFNAPNILLITNAIIDIRISFTEISRNFRIRRNTKLPMICVIYKLHEYYDEIV